MIISFSQHVFLFLFMLHFSETAQIALRRCMVMCFVFMVNFLWPSPAGLNIDWLNSQTYYKNNVLWLQKKKKVWEREKETEWPKNDRIEMSEEGQEGE